MIPEGLKHLATPLDKLNGLPGNPRQGDIGAVMRSYDRFGQRKPIIATKDGTVIAGNHQLEAARLLGWKEIAVLFVDDDEKTAKAYSLADNRTGELGSYDKDLLAEMLSELSDDADLLSDTGYSAEFLDALVGGSDDDDVPDLDDFPIINPDDLETAYACPSCGYEWSGAPRPNKPSHEPDE